ncbi:hypothetical protein LXL04_004806 [Taraxacum kok-saghyz]
MLQLKRFKAAMDEIKSIDTWHMIMSYRLTHNVGVGLCITAGGGGGEGVYESFNPTIIDSRKKPIITMLEE